MPPPTSACIIPRIVPPRFITNCRKPASTSCDISTSLSFASCSRMHATAGGCAASNSLSFSYKKLFAISNAINIYCTRYRQLPRILGCLAMDVAVQSVAVAAIKPLFQCFPGVSIWCPVEFLAEYAKISKPHDACSTSLQAFVFVGSFSE